MLIIYFNFLISARKKNLLIIITLIKNILFFILFAAFKSNIAKKIKLKSFNIKTLFLFLSVVYLFKNTFSLN